MGELYRPYNIRIESGIPPGWVPAGPPDTEAGIWRGFLPIDGPTTHSLLGDALHHLRACKTCREDWDARQTADSVERYLAEQDAIDTAEFVR